jgi:predicted O-linked N-acetylglucosamine transferase (SPINDLY family)
LPAGCPFYLCPQSLFKLHPDFDEVLAGILAEDPIGILGLLAPARAEWAERVEQRLDRLFPGSSRRIFWIPALSQEDFLRLLAHATVILDPFPFGGGNTSLEALAASAPVVTLPSAFLRGRLTLAWYKSLNLENQPLVVVHSPAAYIQAATTLARNPTVRQSLQSQIQETSPMLFNRKDMITAFEQFCRDVLA